MPGGGSRIFTDADGYQAIIRDILDLLVLQPREFNARLIWAELPDLQLLRAKESSARVGFMSLPSDQVFVTYALRPDSALLYGDIVLKAGELMLHSSGERVHQRTTAACEWASLAVTPAALAAFARALSGKTLVAPAAGQVVHPRRADGRRLEHLHAQACRLVERNLDTILNHEVVRALEHDLIWALITCLANGTVQEQRHSPKMKADALPAFEALLAIEPHRLLSAREICASLRISEATLRANCLMSLGMGPGRYQRFRRIKLVRAELLRTKLSSKEAVEEAVVRYGFSSLHRFVTEHWVLYGEIPPIPPLGRASK
jgi:AraC-like DNA-binding protein